MDQAAIDLILKESEADDGILIRMRMADPPPAARFNDLYAALETLAETSAEQTVLDKNLAAALHALSFHLEGHARLLQANNKLPEALEDMLPMIYACVDEIFGV